MSLIALIAGALTLVIALLAPIHAVGIWLAVMVGHGMLVEALGEGARNLPLVAAVGMLAALVIRGRVSLPDTNALMLTGGLVLLMIVAALTGLDPGNSLFWLMQYMKAFALALIVGACVRDERELRLIACYFVSALAVGALMAIWQYRSGNAAFQGWYEQRAATLRGDPNDTAMLLVAGVPLAVYGALRARSVTLKALAAIAFAILVAGIAVTGSRGGFLSLAFVLALMYWRHRSVATTAAAIIGITIGAVLAPTSYWERMNSLLTWSEVNEGESLQSRQALLVGGAQMVVDHPLLGVGAGNFGAAFMHQQPSLGPTSTAGGIAARQPLGVAHNLYLEFFAENGVLAGALLLWLLGYALAGYLVRDRAAAGDPATAGLGHAFAVSFAGMLLAGVFLSQGKNAVLWFLVGLGLAARNLPRYVTAQTVAVVPGTGAVERLPFPQLMR